MGEKQEDGVYVRLVARVDEIVDSCPPSVCW